ncbi:unnamed protein product [Clavelina lepadiformis]|uniref:SCP domain-containing protein n=1 Tax=Clavelina lepadiformis TaxID=159417 RepID=A0ABP0GQ92_CLALP
MKFGVCLNLNVIFGFICAFQCASARVLETYNFTDSIRTAVVDAHNLARRLVSPPAQNMRIMSWDNQLARLASQYSRRCLFKDNEQRSHSRFQPPGENIFVSRGLNFDRNYAVRSVVDWDAEKAYYSLDNGCQDNQICGHYTQVVWSDTFKVGCGASKCTSINVRGQEWRDATVLICNYGPSGNVVGRLPYVEGQSCEACHSSDRCENKLCTNPMREASVPPTPTWTEWGQWTECSATCGRNGGARTRRRSCSTTVISDCTGASINYDIFTCVLLLDCPTGGGGPSTAWNAWGRWSECSRSCGSGRQSRMRRCSTGNVRDCSGGNRMNLRCNTQPCVTTSAVWRAWGRWGDCSQSCGGGRQSRTRTCSTGTNGDCSGTNQSSRACNTQVCPSWRPWSAWGTCSKTCGAGQQARSRTCSTGNDQDCDGRNEMTSRCKTQDCPTWRRWSTWSDCSKSCDGGERSRSRNCSTGNNRDCDGKSEGTEACNTQDCPTWLNWNNWSSCTSSCGGGKRTRRRICSNRRRNDCTGSDEEGEACQTSPCPDWLHWSTWSDCSKSCGSGERSRSRNCSTGNNRDCDGTNQTTEACNAQDCPAWLNWNNWSSCTASCGGGTRTRRRICSNGRRNDCTGSDQEIEVCQTSPCPEWLSWSPWSDCSKSCGSGERSRSRICSTGNNRDCDGRSEVAKACNVQDCPTWEAWGAWESCSRTCGGGMRTRTRSCSTGSIKDCTGDAEIVEDCNTENCLIPTGIKDLSDNRHIMGPRLQHAIKSSRLRLVIWKLSIEKQVKSYPLNQ